MFKNALKSALVAGSAIAAMHAAPAAAQAANIAVVEMPIVVASSTALQNGFQQIGTQYTAQITQIEQLSEQRQSLMQTLDTNGDGQLDEAEQAALTETNPTVQQINSIDQQLQQQRAPIELARLFVVSQVAQQYAPSVQQVISERNISVVLSPDTVVYAAPELDITEAATTALNTRLPSVSITPAANFQPTQQTVNMYQQVQQVFAMAAAQQQAAAAQQGAAAAAPAAAGR